MQKYKNSELLKIRKELNQESEQFEQIIYDDPEKLMEKLIEIMKHIDSLCNKREYFQAVQMLKYLILYLDDNFFNLDENLLLTCVEKSIFFQFIPNFLTSNDINIQSTILFFFICFSSLSGDFIDIILRFFMDKTIFSHFLLPKKIPDKITIYFYILLGLFAEYSEEFNQYLIDISFIDYSFQIFQNANISIQVQILNFISRMTLNSSDNINFDKCLESFEFLILFLNDYFTSMIQKQFDNQQKELIIFILDIFYNIYYVPQLQCIFLKTNIPQLILNSIVYCKEDDFFTEIFQMFIKILNLVVDNIQKTENANKVSLLFTLIQFFVNHSKFSEKPIIIMDLISMINKLNKNFVKNLDIPLLIDILANYVDAEINFRKEILSCLDFLKKIEITSNE